MMTDITAPMAGSYKAIFVLSIFMIFLSVLAIGESKSGSLGVIYWGYTTWKMYRRENEDLAELNRVALWLLGITFIILGFLALADSDNLNNADLSPAGLFILNMLAFGLAYLLYNFFNGKANKESLHVVDSYEDKEHKSPKSSENFFANEMREDTKINDDEIWASALQSYEKKREPGLYARLYAEHGGNEQLIKSGYLSIKFKQLKAEQIEDLKEKRDSERARAETILKDRKISGKMRRIEALATGLYDTKTIRGDTYWVLYDGKAAVPGADHIYVFASEGLAIDAIEHYRSYATFKTKGLEQTISKAEFEGYLSLHKENSDRKPKRMRRKDPNLVERIPRRK
jgi:hypothetical protein